MSENRPLVEKTDEVLGGLPVFFGTRVPISTLNAYLEAGQSIDDFLDDFPTVSREQVLGLLKVAEEAWEAAADAASA